MAFDGITIHHLIKELHTTLVEGRIRKIFQPENDEIRFLINKGKENFNLLISANANNPRAYLTEKPKSNPTAPPSFCMVLRKYILNGIVIDITQHESDRVLIIHLACKNDFNETVTRHIMVELMGRNSNIILTTPSKDDPNTLTIMDSLKKVGISSNRYRQILPGRDYIYPPESNRFNFFTTDQPKFFQLVNAQKNQNLTHGLVQGFLGVSPGLAQELCFRAGVPNHTIFGECTKKQLDFLYNALKELQNEIQSEVYPVLYYQNRDILDFSTLDYHHMTDARKEVHPNVSQALESFFFLKDKKIRLNAQSSNLKHQLTTLFKKNSKKLQNLQNDMQKSYTDEKSKLYGDLITAYIYQLSKGMKSASLVDYTDPDMKEITIALKVNETPAQNAQRFYKKYNKAKRAQIQLEEQIQITSDQVYYLDSLLGSLEQCTEIGELEEIRHEFNQSEFSKGKSKFGAKKEKKPVQSSPLHYISSEGFHIYVGKNNYQNDRISTKLGIDEDCWLHVKDIPGSHVLIVANGRFITEATLLEAGMLAAWHSKAKNSQNVPVDYLEFKDLKKPSKAKPGMVIFTNQNTMYVTPKKASVDALELVED